MDREEFARHFHNALADDDAQAARVEFCRVVTDALLHAGQALQAGGYILRDDPATGLSVVVRMGGALAQGACDLLAAGNAYAAAALARQFVEVEYLLWTFADDPEDAERWLHASRSQLEKRFIPGAMRARSSGRFRSQEYRTHCERGGHPSPRGWPLVASTPPYDPVRSGWADLGQHLERAWGLLLSACAGMGYGEGFDAQAELVERQCAAWHACDVLADRLPPEWLVDGS